MKPYLLTYTIAQLFVNYILRSPQGGASIMLAPTLPCWGYATILDRPPLFSIARHYSRSPTIIIDRDATPIEHTTY